MSQGEEMNQRLHKISKKKLGINLAINWFVPLVLVILLRSIYANDAIALAIAGAIPAVRTIALLVWRRRVDWIGVISVLGFAAAFTVSVLSGGSSLPLKLYHPVITSIIGFGLLISVVIRRPLLIIIFKVLKKGDTQRFSSPSGLRKLNIVTAVFGFIFIIDAVIHIIMALTLPTVTYLYMSRVVTWAGILIIVVSVKWIARRNK